MGKKQTKLKLLLIPFMVLGFTFIFGGKAHAATIDVATGNDETTVNSNCSLSEAITNINNGDAASYPECTGTGTFGTNDTINLPDGTITLVADLPSIDASMTIHGEGISKTEVNGNGQWTAFLAQGAPNFVLNNLKIVAFHNIAVTSINNGEFKNLDIDGSGGLFDGQSGGIFTANFGSSNTTLEVEGVHVHSIGMGGTTNSPLVGIANVALGTGNTTSSIKNTTVDSLSTNFVSIGIEAAGGLNGNTGTASIVIENTTISDIVSTNNSAAGFISVFGSVEPQTITHELKNLTITKIRSQNGVFNEGSGIMTITGAQQSGDTVTTNLEVSNLLLSDNLSSGQPSNCLVGDDLFAGQGTAINNFNSNGGNLSDDSTCSSYFTQPTDHNNLTNLVSTLGALSNNGGYVPTIPLLAGSPAIDAGVPVAGLTTDARLVSRPQGTAFDSGAYESIPTASLASTGESITPFAALAGVLTSLGAVLFVTARVRSSSLTR